MATKKLVLDFIDRKLTRTTFTIVLYGTNRARRLIRMENEGEKKMQIGEHASESAMITPLSAPENSSTIFNLFAYFFSRSF